MNMENATSAFGEYAYFYDLLYQEKDYESECDFLEEVFKAYAANPVGSILDLGCGTGGHALPLARRGYVVTGVDRSETMLAEARRKAKAKTQGGGDCDFVQGDIRALDLGQIFDVVIAMFAVISYQTTNEDLAAAFRTARRHLEPGGLFVFDCWFGPAVVTQRPADRYRVVERGGERVIRFASPTLDVLRHTVQVDYKVLRIKDSRVLDEVDESHLMRFLFPQEIEHYLVESGFEFLRLSPFMKLDLVAAEQDWNVTVIARAKG